MKNAGIADLANDVTAKEACDMGEMRIILASTSRYRRALLERAGIFVESVPPSYDERAAEREAGDTGAERLIGMHGRGKARAVLSSLQAPPPGEEVLVIGSDQGLVFEGEAVGKPGTVENAVAQLKRFSSRTCRLVTSLCVIRASDARMWEHTDVTELVFAPLTEAEIRAYVEYDMPLDCAGSFKIESRGPMLFDAIRTSDPTAIEGLPVMSLHRILREARR